MVAKRNMQPGFDGQFEPSTRVIESPYRKGDKDTVPFNARESNARRLNLGQAQSEAFERTYRLYYRAGYFNQGAVDTTKDPVDGGGVPEPMTERTVDAFRELALIARSIGANDYRLVKATCLDGLGFKDVARIMFGSAPTHNEIQQATWHVKSAYNRLAIHYGLAGTPSYFARLKAWSDGEKATDKPELRDNNP